MAFRSEKIQCFMVITFFTEKHYAILKKENTDKRGKKNEAQDNKLFTPINILFMFISNQKPRTTSVRY